jgi:hypothetical protein
LSRIRLYFDEDAMQEALVVALRARRIEVSTPLDCGMIGRSDEDHLHHAASDGRVLYSFNVKDFSMLARRLDRRRTATRRHCSRIPAALLHWRAITAPAAPN